MKPENLIFIFPDQFSRDMAGCYGNTICQTPNIDSLAENGVRFTNTVSPSPICMPARAAMATGKHIHETHTWDNAHPYTGETRSWHHRLREAGYLIDAVGKLHFRSSTDDNGFSREINTMHMAPGKNAVIQCLRNDTGHFNKRKEAAQAGPGVSDHIRYDIRNADQACRWIEEHRNDDKPWCLFVGFVTPHPPMTAPPDLFEHYMQQDLPLPPQWNKEQWPDHPAMDFLRRYFLFQDPLNEQELKKFIAAYYALCTFVDQQTGKILEIIKKNNLNDSTRIIFSSDHGEDRGARGVFGKFNMYDESCAVPLIMSGPDIPAGTEVTTPVSLVDCYPTVLDFFNLEKDAAEQNLPGTSLMELIDNPQSNRTVFSEYHAIGSTDGIYMLRDLRYKYIYHVGKPAQLFNLQDDPKEEKNLAGLAEYSEMIEAFHKKLKDILDPEKIDNTAKADQMALVEEAGGVDKVRSRGALENTPVPGV